MPKQLLEIKNFNAGIITSVDEADIPLESASFSTNIDSNSEGGVLTGVQDDTILRTNGTFTDTASSVQVLNAKVAKRLNIDGEDKIIYYDTDNTVRKIDTFNSTPTNIASSLGSVNSSDNVSMEINNEEVHIGLGNGGTHTPKWAGIVKNEQFGSTPSGIQMENAELENPEPFPSFHKVAQGTDYIYGVEYGGNRVWKFDISTRTLYARGPMNFTNITAMCLGGHVDTQGRSGSYLLVYDKDANAVYKVDRGTLQTLNEYKLPSTDAGGISIAFTGSVLTDMIESESLLWFFYYNAQWIGGGSTADLGYDSSSTETYRHPWGILYTAPTSALASSGTLTITDRTPASHRDASDDVSGTTSQWEADGELEGQIVRSAAYDDAHRPYDSIQHTFVQYNPDYKCPLFLPWGESNEIGLFVNIRLHYAAYSEGDSGGGSGNNNANDALYCTYGVGLSGDSDVTGASNTYQWNAYPIRGDNADIPVGILVKETCTNTQGAGVNITGNIAAAKYLYFPLATAADFQTVDITSVFNSQTALVFGISGSTNIEVRSRVDSIATHDAPFTSTAASQTISIGGTDSQVATIAASGKVTGVYIEDDSSDTSNLHIFSGTGTGAWGQNLGNGSTWALVTTSGYRVYPLVTITPSDIGSGDGFVNTKKYFYKVCFIYDNYQYGPLSSSSSYTPTAATTDIKVTIEINNVANTLSKRISHVVLFRAESNSSSDTVPLGYYRFVKQLKLDSTWTAGTDSAGQANKKYEITDNGTSIESYGALAGVSETLDHVTPHYTLSTQINSSHIIANCYHVELGTVPNYLMKSKPYKYNQFDWTQDILRLPTTPTAITAFRGRIYVFDENNTYKIEPNNLFIEDTFEGVGCSGSRALTVTEYGMFFCNKQNIWVHDGNRPSPIGNAILKNYDSDSTHGWQENTLGANTLVIFDSKRNSVYFTWKGASLSTYNLWSYHIFKNRWDNIELDSAAHHTAFSGWGIVGYFTGRDGDIYISVYDTIGSAQSHALYKFLGSTTNKRTWFFRTKKINMGTDTQIKKLKSIKTTGTATGSLNNDTGIKYYADGSELTATNTLADAKFSGADGKYFQIKLEGQTNTVDSIGILYRPRPIK